MDLALERARPADGSSGSPDSRKQIDADEGYPSGSPYDRLDKRWPPCGRDTADEEACSVVQGARQGVVRTNREKRTRRPRAGSLGPGSPSSQPMLLEAM